MPTYEYRCESCGEKFEHTEHLAEHQSAPPPCPKCGSDKVQHMRRHSPRTLRARADIKPWCGACREPRENRAKPRAARRSRG